MRTTVTVGHLPAAATGPADAAVRRAEPFSEVTYRLRLAARDAAGPPARTRFLRFDIVAAS